MQGESGQADANTTASTKVADKTSITKFSCFLSLLLEIDPQQVLLLIAPLN